MSEESNDETNQDVIIIHKPPWRSEGMYPIIVYIQPNYDNTFLYINYSLESVFSNAR